MKERAAPRSALRLLLVAFVSTCASDGGCSTPPVGGLLTEKGSLYWSAAPLLPTDLSETQAPIPCHAPCVPAEFAVASLCAALYDQCDSPDCCFGCTVTAYTNRRRARRPVKQPAAANRRGEGHRRQAIKSEQNRPQNRWGSFRAAVSKQSETLRSLGSSREGLVWELDYIQPLYRSPTSSWLLSLGSHNIEDRHFGGGALVYRYLLSSSSLAGASLFIDADPLKGPCGGSCGIEYRTPFFRFSSNGYLPIAQNNRAADDAKAPASPGIAAVAPKAPDYHADISGEGFMVAMPSISLAAEYSRPLAAKSTDNADTNVQPIRQGGPGTATLTIHWRPVPVCRLSLARLYGPGVPHMCLNMVLQYNFDQALRQQFKPVVSAETVNDISRLRHSFVHRSNYMYADR